MQQPLVYLDYNATTPVDHRVLQKMLPYFSDKFGNSISSTHAWGWDAEKAVKLARNQVADFLNCEPSEIIFTSGATESNNWVVIGLIDHLRKDNPNKRIHFITSPTEHSSVRNSFLYAQTYRNVEISWAPVNKYGQTDVDKLYHLINEDTFLLSFMWANNEIGSLNPMQELSALAHEKKVYLHTDATQAVGKIPVDLQTTPVDLLSFSAHKLYGPKGIGILYMRSKNPNVSIAPLFSGGGHEKGLRAGTLNVPAIVGIGEACFLAKSEFTKNAQDLEKLSSYFLNELRKRFPQIQLNGHPTERTKNNLSLTFHGYKVPVEIPALGFSRGSACTSSSIGTPSPVLTAIGRTADEAAATIRFSLSPRTSIEDLDAAIDILSKNLIKY